MRASEHASPKQHKGENVLAPNVEAQYYQQAGDRDL